MRINLGDIVPLHPTGSKIGGTIARPGATDLLPRLPALPTDLAGNFWSNFSGADTVPPYAADLQDGTPDSIVSGGPFFVPAQPNFPPPFSGQPNFSQPFRPTTIIPDSQLPPTLSRESQILLAAQGLFVPTAEGDMAILQESALWRWISENGGLKGCCGIADLNSPLHSAIDPLHQKPRHGIDFQKPFFQPLSAFQSAGAFTGLDVVIGQWQVPIGFDGVLKKIVFGFTGDGFIESSQSIVWRLQYGQRYARDFGNVINTYGDLQTALLVQDNNIEVISGQTITLIANIAVNAPVSSGQVFAGTFGWIWSRR